MVEAVESEIFRLIELLGVGIDAITVLKNSLSVNKYAEGTSQVERKLTSRRLLLQTVPMLSAESARKRYRRMGRPM